MMRELLPSDIEAHTLDSGLHLHPEKLRGTLQAMIDGITPSTETITFGYGLCSTEVLGLQGNRVSHHCIKGYLGNRLSVFNHSSLCR